MTPDANVSRIVSATGGSDACNLAERGNHFLDAHLPAISLQYEINEKEQILREYKRRRCPFFSSQFVSN
jgi:hypothetical protein